jgi:4-amino-4-deoxy-L-arabinose transferase-like glycosyltransferase
MTLLRRLVRSRSFGIGLVMLGFVMLGFAYDVATPIFEKPDENWHFAYIKSLVDGRGFPSVPIALVDDAPAQESSQPPLYYLTAALAVRVLAPDTGDFRALLVRNPSFPYRNEVDNDNKNRLIHAAAEAFPYQGTTRAAHVARGVALLFGALAVWATYRLGLEISSDRPAIGWLAAGIVAFTPQFLFISSSASNDSAAAAMCACSLWLTVRVMRRGFTLRRSMILGALLSLAALSKASAAALIPLSVMAVAAVDHDGRWRFVVRLRWSLLILGIAMIIAGPWYLHVWNVFGDPLGTSTHMAVPWTRPEPLPVSKLPAQLPGAIASYWLAFGWGNIVAPDGVYGILDVIAAIGLIGVGWQLIAHWPRRGSSEARWQLAALIVLLAWVAVIFVALLRWIQLLNASLGRLLFPAIAAVAVLIAYGWLRIWRSTWAAVALAGALGVLALMVLPTMLIPAYARPSILAEAAIEQSADVRYGDVVRLIRVDAPHDRWPRPGEGLFLNLCWEPLTQDNRLLVVLVQIVGENNRVVASRRTVPGLGSYPTGSWQPGGRFCDRVHVQLDNEAPAPAVYHVEVGLIDQGTGQRLDAFAPDGSPRSTDFVDAIKIAPGAYTIPAIDRPIQYRLGDQFELIGYRVQPSMIAPGGAVQLRLYWRALRRADRDYTAFVHVRGSAGENLTQADGPPQSGTYPTSYWDADEVVIDDRMIEIPAHVAAGQYSIVVGLYDPQDNTRLLINGDPALTEIKLPMNLDVQP